MAHALYKAVRLLFSLFLLSDPTPLHQLIIHADVVGASAMLAFWYYLLFTKYPDVFVGILQMTLTGNFGQGKGKLIIHQADDPF